MRKFLDQIPFSVVVIASLTLGLAPFTPMPHVVEKLMMLSRGALTQPMDWFDLFLHGGPWLILAAKLSISQRPRSD